MAIRESFEDKSRKSLLNEALCDGLSQHNRNAPLNECGKTALALTALFDREAGLAEALQARRHLAECAQCTVLWQAWSQQHQEMARISAPVPVGVLTRILTAIRLLSALPQIGLRLEARSSHFEPRAVTVRDADLLSEVVFMAGANPFAPRRSARRSATKIEAPREAPPLDPLSPFPPAGLRDEILRRTVGTGPVAPQAACSTLGLEASSPVRSNRSAGRTLRFTSALMPALAAWLIIVSGPSMLWSSTEPSGEAAKSARRAEPAIQQQLNAIVNTGIPANSARRKVVSMQSNTVEVVEGSQQNSKQEPVDNSSGIVSRSDVDGIWVSPEQTRAQSIASANLSLVPQGAIAPSELRVTSAPQPTVKMTTVATISPEPEPEPVRAPRLRPATTAADVEIHTRRASWGVAPAVPDSSRVAWPTGSVTHVAAPEPATNDDVAEGDGDAEALEHVNRLNDNRPEDVRSILDEFRASLLDEGADDDTAAGVNQS